MKRVRVVMIVFFLIFTAQSLFSQVLNTQGVLRDGTGHSVADGMYSITFRIWNDASVGTAVFTQVSDVEVTNGVYSIELGSVSNPLNMLNSSESYWLGIEVASDGEMTPRHKLNVSPYEFAKLTGDNNVFPGSGNVGVGTTGPSTTLDVRGESPAITVGTVFGTDGALFLGNPSHGVKRNYISGNNVGLYTTNADVYLSADGVSDEYFVLKNNGYLGVGTNSPRSKLMVHDGIAYVSRGFNYNTTGTYTYLLMGCNQHQSDASANTKFLFDIENTSAGSHNIMHLRAGNVDWSDDQYGVPDSDHKTNIMSFSGNGNVGIGKTNPGAALDVSGNVRLDGTHLTFNSDHGVIDWGNAGSGNLYFRTLQTRGDIGEYEAVATITGNGRVGVGTRDPGANLDVRGNFMIMNTDTWMMDIYPSWDEFNFNLNGTRRMVFKGNGELFAGSFVQWSDPRLKRNVELLDAVLPKVMEMKASTFEVSRDQKDWRSGIGFMADEIQKYFPQVVSQTGDGYMGIDYSLLSTVAIAAIQEQQQIIDKQQVKILNQQDQIDELKDRLDRLETLLKKN